MLFRSDAQIMATLNHESIHAMRELGMITEQEWENLKKIADRNGWIELFNIPERGYKGEELQYEEAIAEAFATYTTGRSTPIGYANDRPQYVYKKDLKLSGQPVGIIKRILKMLRVIHTAKQAGRIGVVSTYCGAHSVPAGMDADAATRDVIDNQLPELVVSLL